MSSKHYSNNLTIKEIEELSKEFYDELFNVQMYLNELGKCAMQAHKVINHTSKFADTKHELAEAIEVEIQKQDLKEGTIKNLNHFIKKYL